MAADDLRISARASIGESVASKALQVAAERATTQPAIREPANEAAVRSAAQQIDSYLKRNGRAVEFRVDETTGTTVVTVRETATGDVIRQIPNEEVLQLAHRLREAAGAVIDLAV